MEMEKNTVYCEACLSVNRRMHPLSQLLPLIQETKLEELHLAGSICWECKAHLMKYFKFKRRVRLAQEFLQQQKQNETLPSLSSIIKTQTLNISLSDIDDDGILLGLSRRGNESVNKTNTSDLRHELPMPNHAINTELEENEVFVSQEQDNTIDPLLVPSSPIKLETEEDIEMTLDNETNDDDDKINIDPNNFNSNPESIPEYYKENMPKITTVKPDILNEKHEEYEAKSFHELEIKTPNTSVDDRKQILLITELPKEYDAPCYSNNINKEPKEHDAKSVHRFEINTPYTKLTAEKNNAQRMLNYGDESTWCCQM